MSLLRLHDGTLLAVVALSLAIVTGCTTAESPTPAGSQTQTPADEATDGEVVASISPQELAERIEAGNAPLVLDVRSEEEFAQGHIPGAVNIPHDQLEDRMAELVIDPSDEVVVHCQGGRRAQTCEKLLRDAGFTKVYDLEGHYGQWKEEQLPEEQ